MAEIRKVKIKTWVAMIEEFGYDEENDSCDVHGSFTQNMEDRMPEGRVITVVCRSGWMDWIGWQITEDMIEEEINY